MKGKIVGRGGEFSFFLFETRSLETSPSKILSVPLSPRFVLGFGRRGLAARQRNSEGFQVLDASREITGVEERPVFRR